MVNEVDLRVAHDALLEQLRSGEIHESLVEPPAQAAA
jgi:hypothetical protein